MRETYKFSKEEAISVMEDLADLDIKPDYKGTFTFKGIVSGESREKGKELFKLSDNNRYLIDLPGRYLSGSGLADLVVSGALFLDQLGRVALPEDIAYESRFQLYYLIKANPQLDLEGVYKSYRSKSPGDDGYWHLYFNYNDSLSRSTEEGVDPATRLSIFVNNNDHSLRSDSAVYVEDFKALYMGIFGNALRVYHSPLTQS